MPFHLIRLRNAPDEEEESEGHITFWAWALKYAQGGRLYGSDTTTTSSSSSVHSRWGRAIFFFSLLHAMRRETLAKRVEVKFKIYTLVYEAEGRESFYFKCFLCSCLFCTLYHIIIISLFIFIHLFNFNKILCEMI